jgi:hypothetical protein
LEGRSAILVAGKGRFGDGVGICGIL